MCVAAPRGGTIANQQQPARARALGAPRSAGRSTTKEGETTHLTRDRDTIDECGDAQTAQSFQSRAVCSADCCRLWLSATSATAAISATSARLCHLCRLCHLLVVATSLNHHLVDLGTLRDAEAEVTDLAASERCRAPGSVAQSGRQGRRAATTAIPCEGCALHAGQLGAAAAADDPMPGRKTSACLLKTITITITIQ